MIPVDPDAVEIDFDEARARLRVKGLEVFDDHDLANSLTLGLGLPGDLGFPYPNIPPVFPSRAMISFDVEWNGQLEMALINNSSQRFKGTFLRTVTTIEWSAQQPAFVFQSEAPDPTRNLLSVLGREKNGVFF